MFEIAEERLSTQSLDLSWHITPWDRAAFGGDTAAISAIVVKDPVTALASFKAFLEWCHDNRLKLVSCRLPQDQLLACEFLEAQGFRFIELNYIPHITGLAAFEPDDQIEIQLALPSDAAEISGIAFQIFQTGRLHMDPHVGAGIGNRRYRDWIINAFDQVRQTVFKAVLDGQIVAFMVVERPTATTRFWSLNGVAPGLAGRGLGWRVWRAMLAYHCAEGIESVSTSISSHNVAAHNLYASLGFRFPAPTITLHFSPGTSSSAIIPARI